MVGATLVVALARLQEKPLIGQIVYNGGTLAGMRGLTVVDF